jgi:hypothetical protein
VVAQNRRRGDVRPVVFAVIWSQIIAVVDLWRGLDKLNTGAGVRKLARSLMDTVLDSLEHRAFK